MQVGREGVGADRQLAEVTRRLRARFATVPDAELEAATRAGAERFSGARITAYVPVLVERYATERLRTRAPDPTSPKVESA